MKRSSPKSASSPSVDLLALSEYVERFSSKTIVVLGDFVADAFQIGDITRVSREAPVLILKHRETQIVPGGGANAANNFAALGAKVLPITAVGDDDTGERLLRFFHSQGLDVSGIFRVKDWTTPTKTRFLAGWAHKVGQQVLRVDYEPDHDLPADIHRKIYSKLAKSLKNADALAISDYGFGVVVPSELAKLLSRQKRLISALDSRYRLTAYARSGLHSATPNEGEMEALHHATIGKNLAELERCGRATLAQMKLQSLVITRGRDGLALFQPGQSTAHIPIHGTDQAVDVTGAGDTVLAAYTLGLASDASPLEAAHLANIAGGLVVMKRGTATVSRAELLEAIGASASGANS
ncbi:MAG TPA: PfkB family carbohydrate kinase [Candidatus Eisenbacteria bacterium]|nr:PfkB family carbohydrate kinase [Candidatus Eisenbacteria bacterium]